MMSSQRDMFESQESIIYNSQPAERNVSAGAMDRLNMTFSGASVAAEAGAKASGRSGCKTIYDYQHIILFDWNEDEEKPFDIYPK